MKPNLLKSERQRQGLSQEEIAEALAVSSRTVRRWELGLAVPQPYYRRQLCALLGKTAYELGLLSEVDKSDTLKGISLPNPAENVTHSAAQSAVSAGPHRASLSTDLAIPQALGYADVLLGRDDLLVQVKERLFAADNPALIALSGLPGVGKTALAAMLATDQQVQKHFCDGILWASLGPHPNLLGHLARWGKLLKVVPSRVENLNSREAWGQALQTAMSARRILLIIDDAWTIEDALALQIGGTQCAHLLITRLPRIASIFEREETVIVPQLEKADGLALLSRFVPQLVEQDPEGAQALVEAVGGLPMALTLMGKYLASPVLTEQFWPLRAALAEFHDTRARLCVSMSAMPKEHALGFAETIPLCLRVTIAMCDQRLSPQTHTALCTLATFVSQTTNSFSEKAALAAIQQSVKTLDELWDAGLLENDGTDHYALHQTVADYVCALDVTSSSSDQTVQVWDATDGGNSYTYQGHSDIVKSVAWSPDGKRIASGSWDYTVQVWDVANGDNVYIYRGHSSLVWSVAWSPDGKRIASGSNDQTVQVWDATDGSNVYTYRGHSDIVKSVAWSPDGKRIASGSNDQTVQVWDAADGSNVYTYRGHFEPVNSVMWSPDGKRIVSGFWDHVVQVWDAS